MAGLGAFQVRIVTALGMGGSRGGQGIRKNHKNIGFPRNTGLDSLTKSQSYQASIQCWAIIGTPAKCHLKGVSLAGG